METAGIRLLADGATEFFATLDRVEAQSRSLIANLTGAAAAIDLLDTRAGAAVGGTAALGNATDATADDTAALARASTAAADDVAAYARAATDAAGDATRLGNATDATADDLLASGRAASAAADDIDEVARATEAAAGSTGDAGERLRDASGRYSKLGESATQAGSASEEFGEKSRKGASGLDVLREASIGALRQVGEFATQGLAAAGQAVLSFAADGISAAGDFEDGMNLFGIAVGDSLAEGEQSLEDFRDLFIQLGQELPVSTADVQKAATALAKGGLEPAVIAAGALRDSLNFAAAAGMGLEEAAELTVKQLGTFVPIGASVAEQTRFMAESQNLLVKAAGASTLNVDKLGSALLAAGGQAQASGVNYADFVTTMGLISPAFDSAAEAGTSYKNFLARLQPTTSSASKAMAELGLLTEQGTSRFYDAEGAFIGNRAAAELLQGAVEGLSDAEKVRNLQAIFGNDAMGAANALIKSGAEGYDLFADKMAKATGVQATAAAAQQGYNFALDNAMGSLEALQITLGTAVLPGLTRLIEIGAGGVNMLTEFVAATQEGETWLSALGQAISQYGQPALVGLTTALIAYATVQTVQAIPAILASIPALAAQTTAFVANAAAVLAAAAPYALIAVAVAGVGIAYNDFTSKVSDATSALLESREWWNQSADALSRYGSQSAETQATLAPMANTITAIREQIALEIEDLGKRMAAGMVSEEQYNAEMAVINQHREGLIQATDAYNKQEAAILAEVAAGMTATQMGPQLVESTRQVGERASLTAEELEKLGKAIEDNFAKGQQAVGAYAATYAEFSQGIEERQAAHAEKIAGLEAEKQKATTDEQKAGINDRIKAENDAYAVAEENAAQAYARQQQAQQQHLGQMLIDYTVNQAMLGNISREKAQEITSALEEQYGLQESSVATAYLGMTQTIDRFAADSSGNIDELTGALEEQQEQAGETQQELDAYAKEYVATQTNNFLEGKISAEEYKRMIDGIPKRVDTNVHTTYTESGAPSSRGRGEPVEARASGGAVDAMQPYLVGEQGFELFVPNTAGTVVSQHDIRQALASPAQMQASAAGSTTYAPTTIVNVDARGSSLTEAHIARAVWAGMDAAGQDAYGRILTGG